MSNLRVDYYESLVGKLCMVADGDRLCYLDFAENEHRWRKLLSKRYGAFPTVTEPNLLGLRERLDRYFCAGKWNAFDGLDLCVDGIESQPARIKAPLEVWIEFQRTAWNYLRSIPAGDVQSIRASDVMSYGDVAGVIEKSEPQLADEIEKSRLRGAFWVGQANGNNPIAIVRPCHRVIGADKYKNGYLRGFTGGKERQAWLLGHEGVKIDRPSVEIDRLILKNNEPKAWQRGCEGKKFR